MASTVQDTKQYGQRKFNRRMTGIKWVLLVLVLTFLSPARGDDIQVSCVFMESCILPCSFPPGDEVVIHWYEMTKETLAHSYYHNQDQLGLQDQHFRGRTSLFQDQISRGNASLWLTGVEVQDQGRYKCYTSTITGNKELFINLNVDGDSITVIARRVFAVLEFVAVVGMACCCKKKKDKTTRQGLKNVSCQQRSNTDETQGETGQPLREEVEMEPLNGEKTEEKKNKNNKNTKF
ncbi:butyrophilin-like protein 1 [Perca fluviatilis]|uniref:butyrophilin-like protein 1 n=1 Tax=Perca fluviatilis TaxID=8168 RepID=UPI001962BE06|nr:butyrophilin-like protein 1 [Perca fluviatilis]